MAKKSKASIDKNIKSTKNKEEKDWLRGFHETKSIFFGYIPMSMAFGLLFEQAGAPWYMSPIMCIFVFAGASQYVAVSLLAAQADLIDIALATFVVNLRHIFYGLSLIGKYPSKNSFKKWYAVFGLTDEAYSVLTATRQKGSESFYFWSIFFCHFYWILGSIAGAIAGHLIKADLTFLQFSLTALFVVLAIEQWYAIKRKLPFIVGVISSVIAIELFSHEMLLGAIAISTVILFMNYLGERMESRRGAKA